MLTVLVDVPVHAPSLARLRAFPEVEVRLVPNPQEIRRPLPPELIGDVEVLMCAYPPENLADMRKLRWVQITSAGYSQLFNLGLVERGIRAANGRGNFDVPIGEWNLAMMVNLTRNLRQMIRNQEADVWDRSAQFQGEVRGLTVGIWGYGGIGRETARLAKAMGMIVHVMSRHGVRPANDIYRVPGTGDPEGILPDRVFVAGQELDFLSALDTHYYYPTPPDHPLWKMPNVIFTPHIAGLSLSPHFLARIWAILVQNVQRDLAGRPLLNELTTAQLLGR